METGSGHFVFSRVRFLKVKRKEQFDWHRRIRSRYLLLSYTILQTSVFYKRSWYRFIVVKSESSKFRVIK